MQSHLISVFFLKRADKFCIHITLMVDWSGSRRLKNVQNKIAMCTTSVKPSNSLKQNENKDPTNTETTKKASMLPRVSRLPVPVKNLRLQTPLDFTQSHSKWEENPLTVSYAFLPFISFFFCLFLVEGWLLSVVCLPFRVRQGRRSRAPGQYLLTCRSPGAQE